MNPSSDTGSFTPGHRVRVLVVDPAGKEREMMVRFLAAWNFEPLAVSSAEQARKMAERQDPSIAVITDRADGPETMDLVRALRQTRPGLETILIAENASASFATEAFRAGVYNCLKRPVEFKQLSRDLNMLREAVERRMERAVWDRAAGGSVCLERMVGFSSPMQAVFAALRRFAREDSPVVITGLIGSGKEIAARTLHALSARAQQPLVVYRCCGVSEELAAAELFGAQGPGSGGRHDGRHEKPEGVIGGVMKAALGGTLFLDEIGDLPASIQLRLETVLSPMLRASFGTAAAEAASVRVLAATRLNLAELVARGGFAAPLYNLLSRNVVHLPSLAERSEDIPLLCRRLLEEFNLEFDKQIRGFSPAAERVLLSYRWPGNVRELENVIGRACLLADHQWIELSDLSISRAPDQSSWSLRPPEWPAEAVADSESFDSHPSRKQLEKKFILGRRPAAQG